MEYPSNQTNSAQDPQNSDLWVEPLKVETPVAPESRPATPPPGTGSISRLVMRLSGGLIKTETQVQYVLTVLICGIILLIILTIRSTYATSPTSSEAPTNIPNVPYNPGSTPVP